MLEKLVAKLKAHGRLPEGGRRAILGLPTTIDQAAAKQTVIRREAPLDHSVMLLEGFMCRYKDLRSGRRQISAIHVPGDFLDLHGFTLGYLDHDVMSLTAAKVAYVGHDHITRITDERPALARAFWFLTNVDAAVHREWELSLGQRSGAARAAHLFCELRMRLNVVGLAGPSGFALPLNQTEFGECLGLTSVHTNRVLRDLRESGLAEFRNGFVTIHDLPGLIRLAEFNPAYLYLADGHR